MRRRRHHTQEIGFSFDSFLDVVANVVGIIIRLILVVWVGARSYNSIKLPPAAAGAHPAAVREESTDQPEPLTDEVRRQHQELARLEALLAEQLGQVSQVRQVGHQVEGELTRLETQRLRTEQEHAALEKDLQRARAVQVQALSLEEIRRRCAKLTADIEALRKLPPAKQTLRYLTPVSRPIHSEELLFECCHGRVTFIDIAALMEEMKRGVEDAMEPLRTQWEVQGTAGPVGAFRLRYVVERERAAFETGLGGAPDSRGGFRANVTGWDVEPVTAERGETLAAALAPGSEYRQITDAIDPQQSTVTFWVYPDSFALYRRLRDALYERGVVVAGRPLPEGAKMSFSTRRGTVSRGQ
jgi:hypothetical protein